MSLFPPSACLSAFKIVRDVTASAVCPRYRVKIELRKVRARYKVKIKLIKKRLERDSNLGYYVYCTGAKPVRPP